MRSGILIVLLLITVWANAASDPPPPTPSETTTKPQTHSSNNKRKPNDSYESASSQISAVKNIPSLNHNDVSQNQNTQRSDYFSSEWWMVYLTTLLVIVTALLTYYTAGLWKANRRLIEDARVTSDRQEKAMQDSLSISRVQNTLAEKQDELQRWQYITTHRPRLIIREMSLDGGDGDFFTAGSRSPKVKFIVANVGGSKATIIESNATFARIERDLPATPPYNKVIDAIKCPVREPGQSDPPEFIDITDREVSTDVRSWNGKTITNGESSTFYFFGYVKYKDEIGVSRRMAFCRQYNPSTKRFMRVEDPEYEYGD